MREYPALRDCGRCGAPALFKMAIFAPHEKPIQALARRAHYRCADCYARTVDAAGLLSLADGALVLVDSAYTRDALATLPADETRPLPPLEQTIRRRPPVPEIETLTGDALMRAIADEMHRDGLAERITPQDGDR